MKKLFVLGILLIFMGLVSFPQGKITRPQKNENIKKDYFISNKFPISISVNKSNTLEIDGGDFKISKIEIYKDFTYVYKTFHPSTFPYEIWSIKDEWIENPITHDKLFIIESEIGFDSYSIKSRHTMTFREKYPSIPQNWKKINIGSGSFYFLKYFPLNY